MSTDTDSTSHRRPTLDLPALTDCIDNRRRRDVIRLVGDCPVGSTHRVQELSTALAALENDKPQVRVTSRERKRAYVSLYQTHVDRLAEAGIVDIRDGGDVLVCTSATKTALDALETLEVLLDRRGAA